MGIGPAGVEEVVGEIPVGWLFERWVYRGVVKRVNCDLKWGVMTRHEAVVSVLQLGAWLFVFSRMRRRSVALFL